MIPQAAVARAACLSLSIGFASFHAFPALSQGVDLDVPYVPTPPQVVEKMLDMADVGEGDRVIDLGSGDGRIAIAAAKRGAEAYGVDIDPERVKEAKENAEKAGVADRAKFEERDLFDTNIEDFDVITMYLLTSVNLDLRPTLLELKPGTRIVSHAFSMGSWQPDAEAEVDGRKVYFWKVPADVEGRWTFEHDGQTFNVALKQEFQVIDGAATIDGVEHAVEGRIDGDLVRIRIGNGELAREFAGRINGTALEPLSGESAGNWSARRA